MTGKCKIEWTDAMCPCYAITHGANRRRFEENRRAKSGRHARRIRALAFIRHQMVHGLPRLACNDGIWRGCDQMGWPCRDLRSGAPGEGEGQISAEAAPNARTIIRSGAGRRRGSSQTKDQLFRRGRTDSAPQRTSLLRLFASVDRGGASS